MKAKRAVTCGDLGGMRANGKPCTRPSGWGLGKRAKGKSLCKDHVEEKQAKMASQKKKLLELLADPLKTLVDLEREVGVAIRTMYNWRDDDEDFDKQWITLQATKDRVRVGIVEDNLFKRAAQDKHINPAETIFFLKNRAPERWKDKVEREVTGKDGTPLFPAELLRELAGDDDEDFD
jgi:hypothetical protein